MIKWYLNRFRSMSVPEVSFRIKQMVISKYENFFSKGKPLGTCNYKIHSTNLRIDLKTGEDTPDSVHVFGKDVQFPVNESDWHKDVFSGESFPLTFSKSINIRHNKNLSAKNVWEINRMQCLVNVALNYNRHEKSEYLDQFKELLNSWIKANPYLLGVNWYSNIEVNIRLIVFYFCWHLLDAENLIKKNEEFKSFVENQWIPLIHQHCVYSHKNPSKFSSSNNHLISEYAGLFIATSLWDFKKSGKWNKYAKAGLEKEIQRQHSLNGVNKEEAAEYIQFITDFFLLSYVAGEVSENSFSKEYKSKLKDIFRYIYTMLDVDGNFPQYGDEDDGKCILFDFTDNYSNFSSLLTSGAIIFNDAQLKSKSHGVDTKNMILFGEGSVAQYDTIEGIVPEEKSMFYSEEGHYYFRKREDKKEIYMHFDAAPLGYLSIAAHGHADALSFFLHIDGTPVFIDPGTYTYHTEPDWRYYFIGTLAHNTIRVNKLNQASIAGPTLWLDHYKAETLSVDSNENLDRVIAQHNGYKSVGINHIREVEFDRQNDTFTITDKLSAKHETPYQIDIPFHLHPDMAIEEISKNSFKIQNAAGKRGAIINIDKELIPKIVNGQTSPEIVGWYSKSFMCKEPTNTILSTHSVQGDVELKTTIIIQ